MCLYYHKKKKLQKKLNFSFIETRCNSQMGCPIHRYFLEKLCFLRKQRRSPLVDQPNIFMFIEETHIILTHNMIESN